LECFINPNISQTQDLPSSNVLTEVNHFSVADLSETRGDPRNRQTGRLRPRRYDSLQKGFDLLAIGGWKELANLEAPPNSPVQ
jgi:hypothetical protein